jgi:hypothetical protein
MRDPFFLPLIDLSDSGEKIGNEAVIMVKQSKKKKIL